MGWQLIENIDKITINIYLGHDNLKLFWLGHRLLTKEIGSKKHDMGINLAWFLANHDRKESLDEGDTMHPNRLRVLLLPDKSLNIF